MDICGSLISRPSPSFPSLAVPYCKRREAGRGPGNEATFVERGYLHNVGPSIAIAPNSVSLISLV